MKRIITAVLLVILILTMLCACRTPLAAKPFTNITSFRYYFHTDCIWIEYNLTSNGDTAEITYIYRDVYDRSEDQDLIATVSADYITELTELLNEHNIPAWDGFFKQDTGIVDGCGFGMEITTDSGQEFSARGYERYPKNFEAAEDAILAFFKQFEYTEKPEEPASDAYEDYDYVFTSTFSYEDTVQYYKDYDWGVRRDGFVNTGEVAVEDPEHAIELAKNEYSGEYDTIDIAYDIHSRVYRVTFSNSGMDGGVVNVYISKDGSTLMMTLGE